MSPAARPLRRVRGADRDRLLVAVWMRPAEVRALHWPTWARVWRCRPAQLRRCLLGLPVSSRAAGKILAAVSGQGGGR